MVCDHSILVQFRHTIVFQWHFLAFVFDDPVRYIEKHIATNPSCKYPCKDPDQNPVCTVLSSHRKDVSAIQCELRYGSRARNLVRCLAALSNFRKDTVDFFVKSGTLKSRTKLLRRFFFWRTLHLALVDPREFTILRISVLLMVTTIASQHGCQDLDVSF